MPPRLTTISAQAVYNMLQLGVGKYAFSLVTLLAPALPPGAIYVGADKIRPLRGDQDMAVVFPAPHPPPLPQLHARLLRRRLLAYGDSDDECETVSWPERPASRSNTGVSGPLDALKPFPPPRMSSKQFQLARRKWQPRWQRRREYWQRFIRQRRPKF